MPPQESQWPCPRLQSRCQDAAQALSSHSFDYALAPQSHATSELVIGEVAHAHRDLENLSAECAQEKNSGENHVLEACRTREVHGLSRLCVDLAVSCHHLVGGRHVDKAPGVIPWQIRPRTPCILGGESGEIGRRYHCRDQEHREQAHCGDLYVALDNVLWLVQITTQKYQGRLVGQVGVPGKVDG